MGVLSLVVMGMSRARVIGVLTVLSQVLLLVAVKRPALAPLQRALGALIDPLLPLSAATAETTVSAAVPAEHSVRVVRQIARLQARKVSATQDEQTRLQIQIDALVELLTVE